MEVQLDFSSSVGITNMSWEGYANVLVPFNILTLTTFGVFESSEVSSADRLHCVHRKSKGNEKYFDHSAQILRSNSCLYAVVGTKSAGIPKGLSITKNMKP